MQAVGEKRLLQIMHESIGSELKLGMKSISQEKSSSSVSQCFSSTPGSDYSLEKLSRGGQDCSV